MMLDVGRGQFGCLRNRQGRARESSANPDENDREITARHKLVSFGSPAAWCRPVALRRHLSEALPLSGSATIRRSSSAITHPRGASDARSR